MFHPSVLRSRTLLFGLIAVFGCITVAYANHSWGNYHWARTSNPLQLKLGDNVTSAWDSYLVTTSADWSASRVIDTTIVAGQANSKNCRPTAGRVEVCNATYGNNGWLGIAQVWVSGGHITQGAVKMNDSYFNTAKYNQPAWKNLVMCQEVGHTLGLDHQDENFSNTPLGTCMDYSNDPNPNQHPDSHDYAQLETMYGHTDNTTTATSAPPAMNDMDFTGPRQWGRVVRSSKGGRSETYELDFGGGHKIFTFVIWAEGRERGHHE
jgi:hypothetical protein